MVSFNSATSPDPPTLPLRTMSLRARAVGSPATWKAHSHVQQMEQTNSMFFFESSANLSASQRRRLRFRQARSVSAQQTRRGGGGRQIGRHMSFPRWQWFRRRHPPALRQHGNFKKWSEKSHAMAAMQQQRQISLPVDVNTSASTRGSVTLFSI